MNSGEQEVAVEWRELHSKRDFIGDEASKLSFHLPFRPIDKYAIIVGVLGLASILAHYIALFLFKPFVVPSTITAITCGLFFGHHLGEESNIIEFRRIPYVVPPRRVNVHEERITVEANVTNGRNYRWHYSIPMTSIETCYLSTKNGRCTFQNAKFLCRHKKFSYVCPSLSYSGEASIVHMGKNATEMLGKVSENCLYLDIMTPSLEEKQKKPVVVLLSGFNFIGESNDIIETEGPLYPIPKVVKELDIVFVRMQYRLGLFGTFYHMEEIDKGDKKLKNLGIRDIIEGLRWIKRNIGQFGGNSESVIILGHGSGATATMALLCNSKITAENLFHKVWLASGSVHIPKYDNIFFRRMEDALQTKLSEKCNENPEKCRGREWDRLTKMERFNKILATEDLMSTVTTDMSYNPRVHARLSVAIDSFTDKRVPWIGVDNVTVLEDPFTSSHVSDIPIMLTATASEYEGFPNANEDWFHRPMSSIIIGLMPKLLMYVNVSSSGISHAELLDSTAKHIRQMFRELRHVLERTGKGMLGGKISLAFLSMIRVICPQWVFLTRISTTPRSQPLYMAMHLHKPLSVKNAFLFGEKAKRTSFHGIDMLYLMDTYLKYIRGPTSGDRAYSASLRAAFKKFIHNKQLPWATVNSKKMSFLWDSNVVESDAVDKICSHLNPRKLSDLAKIN